MRRHRHRGGRRLAVRCAEAGRECERVGRDAGGRPGRGSDGNTADDKAFCAFLTEEQPKLREVGSGIGAQAALTIDLAAWVSEHPGQQRRTAAEYDAAAQRGCPEVRASILATTGHDSLQEALR
ncbi:hypothetical protein PV703_04935 [Streptomyces sp. ME01-24h]|nr:hypothetical protein [Streptomyces sp. ME01-24h]